MERKDGYEHGSEEGCHLLLCETVPTYDAALTSITGSECGSLADGVPLID